MRRDVLALLAVAGVIACSTNDKQTAAAPPAAPTTPPPAPAAPAALTEAAVAGSWAGTVSPATSDSVLDHWSMTCANGSCKLSTNGSPKDTVAHTYTLAADSMVGSSAPYKEASLKGTKVVDHWVARVKDGKISGSGYSTLAAKADSVVMRFKFSGARK